MALEREVVRSEGSEGMAASGTVPMGVEEDMSGREDDPVSGPNDSGMNETQSIFLFPPKTRNYPTVNLLFKLFGNAHRPMMVCWSLQRGMSRL